MQKLKCPRRACGARTADFLKNGLYNDTDNKAASTSFTSHIKLRGQLINTLKVVFDCYHRYSLWHTSVCVCYLTMTQIDSSTFYIINEVEMT